MKEFIAELVRVEINEKNRTINGFSSSDEYSKYLSSLFSVADFSSINVVPEQLNDFSYLMDGFISINIETIDNIRNEARVNRDLENDVVWYETLFEVRQIKESYYDRLLSLLEKKITPEFKPLKPKVEPVVAVEKELTKKNEVNDNLAIGYEAIGIVLGCKRTKLSKILKSGILQNNNVVYYIGSRPVLDKGKWQSLLYLNPSILKSLKIK